MTYIIIFSIHTLPRTKIGQVNLDIHLFFYSEQLMHSKRLKKDIYVSSLKKIVRAIFFIEFWKYEALNISHRLTHRPISKNHFFWT